MMQSLVFGNDNSSLPQINQKNKVVKSGAVVGSLGASRLVEGNTLHQIFQTKQYIFKISSTLERMYQYSLVPGTNEATGSIVFRRVKKGDSAFDQLHDIRIQKKRKHGKATLFEGVEYKIYTLVSEGCRKGYMLSYKDAATKKTEYLYFVREN